MENFLYALNGAFCHSNQTTSSGDGLTALSDSKKAMPSATSRLYFTQQRMITVIYWHMVLKEAQFRNSMFYNKTLSTI